MLVVAYHSMLDQLKGEENGTNKLPMVGRATRSARAACVAWNSHLGAKRRCDDLSVQQQLC